MARVADAALDDTDALLPATGVQSHHRALANSPNGLKAFLTMSRFVRAKSTIPAHLRELVILTTGHALGAAYEVETHSDLALAAGVPPEQLRWLEQGQPAEVWPTPVERLLVAYARQVAAGHDVDERSFTELATHMSPEQLVDLALLVGWYHLCAATFGPLRITADGAPAPTAPEHVPTATYAQPASRSAQLHARARRVQPGGSSRTAAFRAPRPPYMRSGAGCWIVDEEREARLDLVLNMTSLVHGHAHPAIVAAACERIGHGSAYSFPTRDEVVLAEHLVERLPAADRVVFTNSGTEAVMLAVRLARAITGRDVIAKVEGSYHGSFDDVSMSVAPAADARGAAAAPSTVVPRGIDRRRQASVVVLALEDRDAAIGLIERHGDRLAAVIIDPAPPRAGLPALDRDAAHALQQAVRRAGALLILDEVVSFRVGPAGMQGVLGLQPDLTALGKTIGGGFPVGAVAGDAAVMDLLDPRAGVVPLGGTFNANPVSMAAGHAAMKLLDDGAYDALERSTTHVVAELLGALRAVGLPATANQVGSLFCLQLRDDPVQGYRSLVADPEARQRTSAFAAELLRCGVALTPGGFGCTATTMTAADLEHVRAAAGSAARTLAERQC